VCNVEVVVPLMAKRTENRTTASFLVGHNSVGKPVFEEVLVDRVTGGRLRIVASPGVALGAAAGDEVTMNSDGTFRVEKRGMNVAIQVYGRAEFADEVLPELRTLGGSFDGRATVGPNTVTVFTVPYRATFVVIEGIFNGLQIRYPEMQWFFANVYDPIDNEPLGWWDD
jgi:Domain of unknown function (DUF4265)